MKSMHIEAIAARNAIIETAAARSAISGAIEDTVTVIEAIWTTTVGEAKDD